MLLGFISDSLFCTPSSDSFFRESTDEEDWNFLPLGAFRAGSRELLGEAESAVPQRNSKFCRVVVLILGINKENSRAEKYNVHSLEKFGSGVLRVGNHLEWVWVVPGHGCDFL